MVFYFNFKNIFCVFQSTFEDDEPDADMDIVEERVKTAKQRQYRARDVVFHKSVFFFLL